MAKSSVRQNIKVVGYPSELIFEIKIILENLVNLYNESTEPFFLKVESGLESKYYTRYHKYKSREDIYKALEANLPRGCKIEKYTT